MSIKRKGFLILVGLVMLLSLLPMQAFALGYIDSAEPISLKVNYEYGSGTAKVLIPNAVFTLYQVANVDKSGTEFTLTEEFAPYAEAVANLNSLETLKSEQWRNLAADLEALVSAKKIKAFDSATTDKNGVACFPSEGVTMKPGLYLLLGRETEYGGYRYQNSGSLIFVPNRNDKENCWEYDVTVVPKTERSRIPDTEEFVEVTVTKKWEDNGYEEERPVEITVYLLRNGEISQTVKLNASNDWTYRWKRLSDNYVWTVAEEPIEGYAYSIERVGDVFVITNTIQPPPSTPPTPPPSNPPEEPPEELPQTGVVWWPLPLMAVLGLALILIGVELRKKSDEKSR